MSDIAPVPKPRARYLLSARPQSSIDRDLNQSSCPDIQTDSNSEAVKLTEPGPASHAARESDSVKSRPATESHGLGEAASDNSRKPDDGGELCTVSEEKNLQKNSNIPKKPRAATIRVSRKKQVLVQSQQRVEAAHSDYKVSQSSWLEVWKGRKHNVLWASLDGQLMGLWKKRTDKFTEYVFHVTSITNVRKADHGRFLVHLQKKHFEFMAHSQDIQDEWVTTLLATRGRDPPAEAKQHGPLVMKDPRKKVYVSICGHFLWIYGSKEDFNMGLGMVCVSMNIASVKQTGRHNFSLITPYRTFSFSADSAKEANVWLERLNDVIRSALSCSEVAHQLWISPWNKICADCAAASPEWASINLLVVICDSCAGAHRSLSSNRSKVRSLKLDDKVWTEPLIQLFVLYGNKAARSVWAHNVPPSEQIGPNVPPDLRTKFVFNKYCVGRYRKAHPLAASQNMLNQRLCEVVVGPNVEETLSLLASGAKVLCGATDHGASAVSMAEDAGQSLQAELLRHNESVVVPDFVQPRLSDDQMGIEELHGKLDKERFLFSQGNDSAACDVLDLTEVISVFDCSAGERHEFEVMTLTDKLTCSADGRDGLLAHMLHIIKVVLAGLASDSDLLDVCAVSKASIRQGGALQCPEVWCVLRTGQMIIYGQSEGSRDTLFLNTNTRCYEQRSENRILMEFAERSVHMQFELQHSCLMWHKLVQKATISRIERPHVDSVPPAIHTCLSHINQYGLKVEGLYRRCGIATQVSKLVAALRESSGEAVLGTDELSILDLTGALKQILRENVELLPQTHKPKWLKAAGQKDGTLRLLEYRRLLHQLPSESYATLAFLCEHLHTVQLHSQVNRMTAHNLAVVFVVTLFQELAMNPAMIQATKDLILQHTQLFVIHKLSEISGKSVHDEKDGIYVTVF